MLSLGLLEGAMEDISRLGIKIGAIETGFIEAG